MCLHLLFKRAVMHSTRVKGEVGRFWFVLICKNPLYAKSCASFVGLQKKCPMTDLTKVPRKIFSLNFCSVLSKCGPKDTVLLLLFHNTLFRNIHWDLKISTATNHFTLCISRLIVCLFGYSSVSSYSVKCHKSILKLYNDNNIFM